MLSFRSLVVSRIMEVPGACFSSRGLFHFSELVSKAYARVSLVRIDLLQCQEVGNLAQTGFHAFGSTVIVAIQGVLRFVQLEAFIETVLLKLAEGKGITRIEQQEAALEVLS